MQRGVWRQGARGGLKMESTPGLTKEPFENRTHFVRRSSPVNRNRDIQRLKSLLLAPGSFPNQVVNYDAQHCQRKWEQVEDGRWVPVYEVHVCARSSCGLRRPASSPPTACPKCGWGPFYSARREEGDDEALKDYSIDAPVIRDRRTRRQKNTVPTKNTSFPA